MLESISPYTLLCQSKPQQPQRITTDYDRFSIKQAHLCEADTDCPDFEMPFEQLAKQNPSIPKRTHYIADIHARHKSAMRNAPQTPPSL